MATIFYTMSGYGKGHAGRARSVLQTLTEHRFIVLCAGDSFDYLAPLYRDDPRVQVLRFEPHLRFVLNNGKVNRLATAGSAMGYLLRFRPTIRSMCRLIETHHPDVALTDVDPVLPRAARRCGVPFITLDSHGMFTCCEMRGLPLPMRGHAFLVRLYVRFCHARGAARHLVSTFADLPIKPAYADKAGMVGAVLRPELMDRTVTDDRFLVAYVRSDVGTPALLETLDSCGLPVHVYAMGERPDAGRLRFLPIGEGFMRDLRACTAIVTMAGNQLIAEAFYLGKPVLAFPMPGQIEQMLNGYYIRASGGGECVERDDLTPSVLADFLSKRERYAAAIARMPLFDRPGNERIAAAIDEVCGARAPRLAESVPV